MHILRLVGIICAFIWACGPVLGATLTFEAQPDPNNAGTNCSWFEIGNWFKPGETGGLEPAGRLPQESDTAVVTGDLDGNQVTVRVRALVVSPNTTITNGTFSVESVQMLDGSRLDGSTVYLLRDMAVSGTNCSFANVRLTILPTATLTIGPGPGSDTADLTLNQGSLIQNMGRIVMTNSARLSSLGFPQNELHVEGGASLISSGFCQVQAAADSPLLIDHNGTICSASGTLRFEDNIDWQCSSGLQTFNAAAPAANISIESAFSLRAGAVAVFNGPGASVLIGSATVEGVLQLGGNNPLTGLYAPGDVEISSDAGGRGKLQVTGPGSTLTWNEGVLSCATVAIDAGGSMDIAGDATTPRQLSGCAINNSGLCTVLSRGLALDDGGEIHNLIQGTFDIHNDGSFTSTGAPAVFNNKGAVLKSSVGRVQFGAQLSSSGPEFNNDGLVHLQRGELCVLGGSSSGEYQIDQGATLWFWGNSHSLETGAILSGQGNVRIEQGLSPARVSAADGVAADKINVGWNGALEGAGNSSANPVQILNLVVGANGYLTNGTFSLGDAQMMDDATIGASTASLSAALSIMGANCALHSSILTILPAAVATLGSAEPNKVSRLALAAASLLDIQGHLALTNQCELSGVGIPASALRVAADAILNSDGATLVQGTLDGGLVVDNSGIIRADSGTLQFQGGIVWRSSGGTATFVASASSALDLFACPFNVDAGVTAVFSGPGTSRLTANSSINGKAQVGAVDVASKIFIPGNLDLMASLGGNGALVALGGTSAGSTVTWSDGALSLRSLTVGSGARMLIAGAGPVSRSLTGCTLRNDGMMAVTSPQGFLSGSGAVINNSASGTLDIQADTALSFNGSGPRVVINNAGAFLKSGGTGLCALAADFVNTGALRVQSGILDCQGLWVQNAGVTTVEKAATLRSQLLDLRGGTVSGSGTLDAKVSNGAAVNPGNLTGDNAHQRSRLRTDLGRHAGGGNRRRHPWFPV